MKTTILTVVLACVFLLTGAVFYTYVKYVKLRQKKVLESAVRSNAIVAELFPSNIRDRVMNENQQDEDATYSTGMSHRLKTFLQTGETNDGEQTGAGVLKSKPIAGTLGIFPLR